MLPGCGVANESWLLRVLIAAMPCKRAAWGVYRQTETAYLPYYLANRMRYLVTPLLIFLVAGTVFGSSEGAKTRAVQPLPEVLYYGRLADATTGSPVVHADVTNGKRVATTDNSGVFALYLPAGRPAMLTVTRSGYEQLIFSVTPPAIETPPVVIGPVPQPSPGGPPLAGSLPPVMVTPKPAVTVRDVNGAAVTVDLETLQFAYVLPFASPVATQTASLCKTDGAPFTPDRSEFARILGPAFLVRGTPCCPAGVMLGITAEMKTGDRLQAYFTDSCAGYDIALIARDHVTALPVNMSFTTISEIVFP